MEIIVKFDNGQTIWETVVTYSQECMFVDHEDMDMFIAVYADETHWEHAIARFDGRIDYNVLD